MLIDAYGSLGYYIYFRTVEFFAINKEKIIILDEEEEFKEILEYIKISGKKEIIEVYEFIQKNIGLFDENLFDRNILQVKGLQTRKEPRNINDAIKGKKHVAEFVYLTQNQIDELLQKYGKEFTMRCIETLNDYKSNHGGVSRYNDDAAAIRNWVVDKTMKEYRFQNYKYPFMNDFQSDSPAQPKFKPRT